MILQPKPDFVATRERRPPDLGGEAIILPDYLSVKCSVIDVSGASSPQLVDPRHKAPNREMETFCHTELEYHPIMRQEFQSLVITLSHVPIRYEKSWASGWGSFTVPNAAHLR
jgi:hypothetical protein